MTVCRKDATFISDDPQDAAYAAGLCTGCPFVQECGELGLGERWWVYGGMLPTHPARKEHRATNDTSTHCINGHRIDLFSAAIAGPGLQPLVVCRRCAALARHIATTDGTVPMPDTEPRRPDLILNHGTEAGYRAHKYRGERPCGSCKRGYALERARTSAEWEAS